MRTVRYIAYRFLTQNEYFVLYKLPDAEPGGGGQRYIDFPTRSVSIRDWRKFFADVPNVTETAVTHGPRWEFPVLSIGLGEHQPALQAALYQRADTRVCLADQNIRGNRIPAWLPENGFPEPTNPAAGEDVPPGLAIFLARTYEGDVWAGWFTKDTPARVCSSAECRGALQTMLDPDNEPGSAGFVEFEEPELGLREAPADNPIFAGRSEMLIAPVAGQDRFPLTRLEVEGYKSIKKATIGFGSLNIFIGANGAGKSNLVSLLSLLSASLNEQLRALVDQAGGANSLLHLGAKVTPQIAIRADSVWNAHPVALQQRLMFVSPNGLAYNPEHVNAANPPAYTEVVPVGNICSMSASGVPRSVLIAVYRSLKDGIATYHFADTSSRAAIRLGSFIEDNRRLRTDGANLPAILFLYQQTKQTVYQRIVRTLKKVIPQFGDFVLEPQPANQNNIMLNWRQEGKPYLMGPHQVSDGSLRVMALVTLLLQPDSDFANVTVLDEPELGLHPHAVGIVAGLVRAASQKTQILAATQSAEFLNYFDPTEIITVDVSQGETSFRHLDPDQLKDWLEDYSVGELWQRNVLGGGPLP